jgi:hypothetical protein
MSSHFYFYFIMQEKISFNNNLTKIKNQKIKYSGRWKYILSTSYDASSKYFYFFLYMQVVNI